MPILINTTNKVQSLNNRYLEVGPKGRINVTQRVLEQDYTQELLRTGVLKLRTTPAETPPVVETPAETPPVVETEGAETESILARRRGRATRQPE